MGGGDRVNRSAAPRARAPVNSWGNLYGKITASFSSSFAPSRPATSSHFTLGFSVTMAPEAHQRGTRQPHHTRLNPEYRF